MEESDLLHAPAVLSRRKMLRNPLNTKVVVSIAGTLRLRKSLNPSRNLIKNYNQQDAAFLEFIYFYIRSTCFRRFLRPSSGAHNCTYSFRYCQPILLLAATVEEMERSSISSTVAANSSFGWQYLKLYVQLCAPDDGRRNRLKHVERL